MDNLTHHHNALEKEEQEKPKVSRNKDIIKKKEKNKTTSPRQEIKLPCKKLGIQM